jgi:hypothetical protein
MKDEELEEQGKIKLVPKISGFFPLIGYSTLVITGFLFFSAVNQAAKVAGAFEVGEKYNVDPLFVAGVRNPSPIAQASWVATILGHRREQGNAGKFNAFIGAIFNDTEQYLNRGIVNLPTIVSLVSPYNFVDLQPLANKNLSE